MNRQPVVALIGATAVGKTALSLSIAEKLNAEIISVDSRQVYRYMDVGTDKVSSALRREVPHHMIDVADPDEKDDEKHLDQNAEQQVDQVHAEEFQMRVVVLVHVHDFQLEVSDNIGKNRAGDHRGNHRL